MKYRIVSAVVVLAIMAFMFVQVTGLKAEVQELRDVVVEQQEQIEKLDRDLLHSDYAMYEEFTMVYEWLAEIEITHQEDSLNGS